VFPFEAHLLIQQSNGHRERDGQRERRGGESSGGCTRTLRHLANPMSALTQLTPQQLPIPPIYEIDNRETLQIKANCDSQSPNKCALVIHSHGLVYAIGTPIDHFLAYEIFKEWSYVILKSCNPDLASLACKAFAKSMKATGGVPGGMRTSPKPSKF